MYVADLLSRNIKQEQVADDDSLTEVVHAVGTDLQFNNDSFERLVRATESDQCLSKVLLFFKNGWP